MTSREISDLINDAPSASEEGVLDKRFTRREVLWGSSALSLTALVVNFDARVHDAGAAQNVYVNGEVHQVTPVLPAQPSTHFSIARPEDLLLLDITFYGFSIERGAKYPSMVATTKKTNSNWIGVIVQFPPQAIGEGVYWVEGGNDAFDPAPVLSQVAGPSRLCFTFNTGDSIPLPTGKVDDLLNWSGWNLSVVNNANVGHGSSGIFKPAVYETSIECPLALILSPVVDGTGSLLKGLFTTEFVNRTAPFPSANNVIECWGTTLTSTREQKETVGYSFTPIEPAVAAVWSTDFSSNLPSATGETNIDYTIYVAPPK